MAHYIPFVATHLATFVLCRCKAFAGVSARPDMAESRREMAIRYVEQGRRIVEDQRDGRKVQSRSRQRSNNSADPNTSAIDLTEGVYRFLLQPNRGYVASASSGATDLLREPLRVGPAQSPQPIQVSIREDVAALRIALTDPAGLDSTSATGLRSEQLAAILCIPLDQPAREPITQFILISSAVNSGTSFGNLAPGRYLVLASRQDDQIGFSPEYRNPDVVPTLLSKGVVVTLSPNDNASITVPLLPAEAQ